MPIFEDPIIFVAIVLAVFKLTDFFLRQHQQRRIQYWAEMMTLQLDYAKPLSWFRDVVNTAALNRGMILISVMYLLVGSLLSFHPLSHAYGVPSVPWFPPVLTVSICVVQAILVLAFGRRVIEWMLKGYAPGKFILRYLFDNCGLWSCRVWVPVPRVDACLANPSDQREPVLVLSARKRSEVRTHMVALSNVFTRFAIVHVRNVFIRCRKSGDVRDSGTDGASDRR